MKLKSYYTEKSSKTKRQIRSILKGLKGKRIKELKKIIISLTPKDNSKTFDILKRDNYRCVFCGDIEDLKMYHLNPRALGGNNDERNLITLCHYCHWYLHNNPKFKFNISKLIKSRIVRVKGKAFSHNGNKWGRKRLSKDKVKEILELSNTNPNMVLREISEKSKVSLGKVHQVIAAQKTETKQDLNTNPS